MIYVKLPNGEEYAVFESLAWGKFITPWKERLRLGSCELFKNWYMILTSKNTTRFKC